MSFQDSITSALSKLETANKRFTAVYPGDSEEIQPVQTLYGGAHLFKEDTVSKIASLSVKHFETFAPNVEAFKKALPLAKGFEEVIYQRVKDKLKKQAVEDFRIDFEDGYGNRPDDEEDKTAVDAATAVAAALKSSKLCPFIGIRIKPLNEELKHRSMRTLSIFLSTLLEHTGGKTPEGFVVTLPKVCIPEQVSALVEVLNAFENEHGLKSGEIKIEIMIEATQAIIGEDGRVQIPRLLDAAKGRCRGAHFGTYDYTASSDITAAQQKMDHMSCDFALHMMKVSLGGTGVWLSDGATSVMPVAIHRGDSLTDAQIEENNEAVYGAWRESFTHIIHSLKKGYYQGWDLHPGQLSVRYAAMYSFFLESLDQASIRLKNFIDKAAQATLVGDVFDDAATGQGLLNFFLRAWTSGAISEEEILKTGLTVDELRAKSFVKIVKNRVGK
jgi:citrate lyase beta subunit